MEELVFLKLQDLGFEKTLIDTDRLRRVIAAQSEYLRMQTNLRELPASSVNLLVEIFARAYLIGVHEADLARGEYSQTVGIKAITEGDTKTEFTGAASPQELCLASWREETARFVRAFILAHRRLSW